MNHSNPALSKGWPGLVLVAKRACNVCCKTSTTRVTTSHRRSYSSDIKKNQSPKDIYGYEEFGVKCSELRSIFDSKPSLEAYKWVEKMETECRYRWDAELKRRVSVKPPRYDNPAVKLILKAVDDETLGKAVRVNRYTSSLFHMRTYKQIGDYREGNQVPAIQSQEWGEDPREETLFFFGRASKKTDHKLATVRKQMTSKVLKAVRAIVENGLKPDGTCDAENAGQVDFFLNRNFIYTFNPRPPIYRAFWLDVVEEVYKALLVVKNESKDARRPQRKR